MQIIIVGCGKVGRELARQLSEEGHNVTIIDMNPEMVQRVSIAYDVMGITGNGASYTTLENADLAHTDILIAVAHSDEVNLLCCFIAKNAPCKKIARVRNPIYLAEKENFRRDLGVSMIINPERTAAAEIRRILEFPSAMDINSFAKGRIDLITFRLKKTSSLSGQKLKNMAALREAETLVCIVEREGEVIIPDGDFVIRDGDVLSLIASPNKAARVFRDLGVYTSPVKNTLIIGGGEIAFYLAEMLLSSGIHVKIIERDRERAEELCDLLPAATVICGDGTSQDLLHEERLQDMDACVAATGVDEENIILSLYARDIVKSKVVTKISHLEFTKVLESLNLDSIIDAKLATTEQILQYVRAMGEIIGRGVETLYKMSNDRVDALEFAINNESKLTGVPIRDMKLKKSILIAGILRKGKLIIPGGDDWFQKGDSVIVATTHKGFGSINDILQ